MNAVTHANVDVASGLEFFKQLQTVTNRIHSSANINEIMLDLSQDISNLFLCDRLTIYAVDEGNLVSKVKTGLNSFADLKLPISDQSIAGYAALHRTLLNIRDVYDEAELKAHASGLNFLQEVDRRTGYRSREMLAAPLIDPRHNDLLGVIQLINNRAGGPFTAVAEEGVKELCATLAIAFSQRLKPVALIRSKYEQLIGDGIISAAEFELATRSARRQGLELEEVLEKEFQVKRSSIGHALSKFFGVPYSPFKPERIKPLELLKHLKRDYVEHNQWLPVEENKDGLLILSTDPEQVKSTRIVGNVFPGAKPVFQVTTNAEFRQTIDQFFGLIDDSTSVGELLSGLEETDEDTNDISAGDISAAADNELV
ncbi:MAG: secretion system protein E, partial [Burkholderiaceae bacterium]